MEDDDPTPRALPRWVELEYKVSLKFLAALPSHSLTSHLSLSLLVPSFQPNICQLTTGTPPIIAHVHARGSQCLRRVHAPLQRSGRCALLRAAPCPRGGGTRNSARRVPRAGRARADASARDRGIARVPAGPQGFSGARAVRRRVCVVPFRRACPLPFPSRRLRLIKIKMLCCAGYTRYACFAAYGGGDGGG